MSSSFAGSLVDKYLREALHVVEWGGEDLSRVMELLRSNPELAASLVEYYLQTGEQVPLIGASVPIAVIDFLGNQHVAYLDIIPRNLLALYSKAGTIPGIVFYPLKTIEHTLEIGELRMPKNYIYLKRHSKELNNPLLRKVRVEYLPFTEPALGEELARKLRQLLPLYFLAYVIPEDYLPELSNIGERSLEMLEHILEKLPIGKIGVLNLEEGYIASHHNAKLPKNAASLRLLALPVGEREYYYIPTMIDLEDIIILPEHFLDKLLLDIYLTPRRLRQVLEQYYTYMRKPKLRELGKILEEVLERYEEPLILSRIDTLLFLPENEEIIRILRENPERLTTDSITRTEIMRALSSITNKQVLKALTLAKIYKPKIEEIEKPNIMTGEKIRGYLLIKNPTSFGEIY